MTRLFAVRALCWIKACWKPLAPYDRARAMIANICALVVLIGVAAITLRRRLRSSDSWRATATPLASIIGSGFLVSLPLLAHEVGAYAPVAILVLLLFGYLLGGAIRFNIAFGEALFEDARNAWLARVDELSRIVLALAYFVSVTYYLSLLAAFALKPITFSHEAIMARALTTTLLLGIGGWGLLRGLRGLEAIEEYAVGLKLAVIAAVVAALIVFNGALLLDGRWRVDASLPTLGIHDLRFVLGLLIVVQGFETSRFLRGAYPADLRIRSMRWAQTLAAMVYLAFFGLSLPLLGAAQQSPDVAGVIDMVGPAASVLPLLVVGGAIFAQLSAAIADAIGAAGLLHETSGGMIPRQWAYPAVAAAGVALVWTFDVFRVIQLASAAFALFYAFQAGVAAFIAMTTKQVAHARLRALGFAILAASALAAAAFGIPAEAAG